MPVYEHSLNLNLHSGRSAIARAFTVSVLRSLLAAAAYLGLRPCSVIPTTSRLHSRVRALGRRNRVNLVRSQWSAMGAVRAFPRGFHTFPS